LKIIFENVEFPEAKVIGDTFPDVDKENPYYEYIEKAASIGIVHGAEDGNFYPYYPVTRGQIAKILVESFEPEEVLDGMIEFEDIPEDHVFHDYIKQAVKAEIFKGYPDGLMRPDRDINYLEAEIVIKRASKLETLKDIDSKMYWRAFIGIHRLKEVGQTHATLNIDDKNLGTIVETMPINVLTREFPTRSFTLPEEKTELFGQTQQDNTWTMINNAKAETSDEQLWTPPFIIPTDGVVTLEFGDKLYINGEFSGSHFGIDYANEEGTEIYAANNGIVTLADETMSYGNTIIIDHGQNVFTMYLHLSELKVEEGQGVSKGDLIGLMGSTGIATGPHLHYTLFIGSVIVDSAEWE
jgi:murein DD-endopeptidase MepM/ murein hydrolase activator NlpD